MDEQSQHINYLWQQFAAKKSTPAELDELLTHLDSEASVAFLESYFAQAVTGEIPDKGYLLERAAAITRVPARIRRMSRRWWAAAAVLIIGLGTTLYITQSTKPKINIAQLPSDVLPGGNKATLTLSGGRKIILDSASNGSLALQGNANIIKRANGQIEYSLNDNGTPTTEVAFNTMTTPRGGQYQLRLPDGTDVWLNSASSITYPTAFNSNTREVTITGEAYFEVVKNESKPFHVKVNGADIKVLGTHFNVNAYGDEATIQTTLLEGSVKVSAAGFLRSTVIKPGQQALLTVDGQLSTNNDVDLEQVMAWKNSQFIFDREYLPAIMRQLSRWYDVDVKYAGGVLTDTRFSGIISRQRNISAVLEMLKGTGNIHFKIENKTIIITP
jgi:transmembrane sensor